MRNQHQRLPSHGPQREALREKGQFWTPGWVAAAMVRYVQPNITGHLFDPATGACAFFTECKKVIPGEVTFYGCDVDLASLHAAKAAGLGDSDLAGIEKRDFILNPPTRKFSSVVANPPYIRHHRLPVSTKQSMRLLGRRLIGKELDGRAGLHVYFLLRALECLALHGRLAFIIPGDTFEGVFARELWSWITRNYKLDAVITFLGDATPFPGVDTNAVIVLIQNSASTSQFTWARCTEPDTPQLAAWVDRGFSGPFPGLTYVRHLEEGLQTGLSRPPTPKHGGPVLADFAKVIRGIATGDNEFFFLTSYQIEELGLDKRYFVRALGRTRDVRGDQVDQEDLDVLDRAGRPTFLLSLDATPIEHLPESIQTYLDSGRRRGIDKRPLVSTRNPWYRMERRAVPPLLFAYLGRRNTRFVLNEAGAVPLTAFLCIYPKAPASARSLWTVLNQPETLSNLRLVAKSYGSDALKVEPRALDQLPIPAELANLAGLVPLQVEPPQHKLAFS